MPTTSTNYDPEVNTPVGLQRDPMTEIKKSLGKSMQPAISEFYTDMEEVISRNPAWERTNEEHRRLAAAVVRRKRKDLKLPDAAIEVCIKTFSTDPCNLAFARVALSERIDLSSHEGMAQAAALVAQNEPSAMPLYGEDARLCERAGGREKFEAMKKIAGQYQLEMKRDWDAVRGRLFVEHPSWRPAVESAGSLDEVIEALMHTGPMRFSADDGQTLAMKAMDLRPDLVEKQYGVPVAEKEKDDPALMGERAKSAEEAAQTQSLMVLARDHVRKLGGDPTDYFEVSNALDVVALDHPELLPEHYRPSNDQVGQ